ncbi:MAG: hypothetical protein BWY19_00202 [bacterium ADurb.Bin212]|nr:MAG: hypothetical protein BWY19_00202 [bacterium ADurb.Bin212]
MTKKVQNNIEPSKKEITDLHEKFYQKFGVKLPKKDLLFILDKTEEAQEADKLFKTALNSWTQLDEKGIKEFREMLKSEYHYEKKLTDFEINDAAHTMSILAMMQIQRKAGEAIRTTIIKKKSIELNAEDKNKLKNLFSLAFNIELTKNEIEYYLTLSYWFAWYREGLDYSLSNALDNLITHYDKKKRGKRGSLKPDDYDIGYFYRWLAYCYKNTPKNKEGKKFTVSSFIKTIDKEFSSIRSFLAGDKCKINKDGSYTMSVKLNDWE